MPGMDGFINFNGTLEGSIADGGSGAVKDVKTNASGNYESVVDEQGIAKIDLSNYTTHEQLESAVDNINSVLLNKQKVINYSTEEQDTGELWIDGISHIFQKSFLATLSGNSLQIDLTGLNIREAWIKDGYYNIGVTNLSLNEYLTGSLTCYTHINTGTTPPVIDCRNNLSNNSTVFITIKYIKNMEV